MWLGCRSDGVIDRVFRKETSVHAIPLHLEPSGPKPDWTNPWLVETFDTVLLQAHNDFHKILVLWVTTRVLFSVKLKWHGQSVLDEQTSNLTCSLIPGYCWPPFEQLGLVQPGLILVLKKTNDGQRQLCGSLATLHLHLM